MTNPLETNLFRIRALVAALAGVAAMLCGRPVLAQSGTFDMDRLQLSGAPDDGFTVWRPHMYDETRFYGMFALGYAYRPLRADTVASTAAVANSIGDPMVDQFNTYFLAGTQIANRASFNVALPITLFKVVNDPTAAGIGTGGLSSGPALQDMRFDMRLRLLETNTVALGLGVAVFAPTGNEFQLAGDGAASTLFFADGDYHIGSLVLAGMLGPHIRPSRGIGGTQGALNIASELRWAFGAYYPLMQGRIRPGVELFGSTGIEGVGPNNESSFLTRRNTDFEWLAQARFVLDKRSRFYAMAGVGTRLAPGYGAPDFRALASIGAFFTMKDFGVGSRVSGFSGAPGVGEYDVDTDGDGFPDAIDKCPTVPGKVNGCPPGPDADGDGIPDAQDHCPKEVGLPANFGCPVKTKVDEETGEVKLLEPIQFEFGKATIKRSSYPIVDEVVAVLKARKKMRMGIYGHTDNVGSDATNLALSKDRAAAVRQYIVDKGIDASRLESEGYGKTKPIADNKTAEGRAKNRRVEFKILAE